MATASFQMKAGIKGLTVPYKGTSPALHDLIGGQVDLMFASVENVRPLFGGARVKFLGVTNTQPMKQFAGVPPISNTLPGFTSKAWFGMRSEEHTSELQSLMRISYAVFSLKRNQVRYT